MQGEYIIIDYWCQGCGLVGNTSLYCPVCGACWLDNPRTVTLDLTNEPLREHLVALYQDFSLFVHRQQGKLALRDHSVSPVESRK